jgi:hypothetical protein
MAYLEGVHLLVAPASTPGQGVNKGTLKILKPLMLLVLMSVRVVILGQSLRIINHNNPRSLHRHLSKLQHSSVNHQLRGAKV